MKNTRIFLADDHALVRAGIRSLLEKLPDVEVVGEAGDGRAALDMIGSLKPDVLLADIAMQGLGGLALAAQVAREFPDIKVLILSMHANEEYVVEALRNGAAGYILKDAAVNELDRALQAVDKGETYLSPALSQRAIDAYIGAAAQPDGMPGPLTPRQRETLRLIAEGLNTKEIAYQLGVSVKTVESHRAQLMERLDIRDIPGLVKYAMRTGLIPPETQGQTEAH